MSFRWIKLSLPAALPLVIFLLVAFASSAGAATTVSGNVTVNTSWTGAASPFYVSGNVTVAANATLTIEAGVVVKFAPGTVLYVSGSLSAAGNPGTGQIYFTDSRDDTAGEDTNGDGNATLPAAGSWSGIYINDGGSANLDYCVIRYAYGANGYAGVSKRGMGTLTLTHSTITNGSAYGVRITDSSSNHTLTDNLIQDNGSWGMVLESASGSINIIGNAITSNANGLYIANSSPLVQGNTIAFNTGYGIQLTGSSATATIIGNRIYSNGTGIYSIAGANPVIGGTLANGNDIYANTGFGLQNDDNSLTLDARYNWWGSSSGPFVSTTNPSGTGNPVSAYVDYGNYFGRSALVQAAHIAVSPASQDFGGIKTGTPAESRTFTVSNNGTLDMVLGTLAVAGPDAAQFGISNDNCSGVTLAPFSACTFQAAFTPASKGAKTAAISIPTNDLENATTAVALTGKGIDCTAPPAGIVAWWAAEDNADDLVGYNPGTANGNITYVAGRVGRAFHFNGADDFVLIPDSPTLDAVNGEITVEGWVRVNTLPTGDDPQATLISKGGGWGRSGWLLTVRGNGNIRWHLGSGGDERYTDNGALAAGVWHHVAATLEAGVMKTYIDGVLQDNTASWDHVYPNDNPLFLGKTDGEATFFFAGDIDEWALYNRALTAEEIAAIHESGYTGKCTAGEVNLTFAVTAPDSVSPGGSLTYIIVATNRGPDTARNVTLTDTLPPGAVLNSATPTQGNCTETGGIVTCLLGEIVKGGSATVTFILTAPSTTALLVNTARVDSDEGEFTPADNQAIVETTVLSAPGDFETDPAATADSAITFWDADFYNHDDAGNRGSAPRANHELRISDQRSFSGAKSVYSFLRNNGGGGSGDANGRHATQELYTELACRAVTSASALNIWRSDIAYTTTSRWAWSFSVELSDGIHTQDVLLACQCWGYEEGCSGNAFDSHDRTALGTDGQTWYRHVVAIPAEMDRANLRIRIRHTQDSWDGTTAESGLYFDAIGPFDLYLRGDVNGGQDVTLADAIAALQVISGTQTPTPIQRTGDVDGNGRIGMEEAVYVLQILSGLRP